MLAIAKGADSGRDDLDGSAEEEPSPGHVHPSDKNKNVVVVFRKRSLFEEVNRVMLVVVGLCLRGMPEVGFGNIELGFWKEEEMRRIAMGWGESERCYSLLLRIGGR